MNWGTPPPWGNYGSPHVQYVPVPTGTDIERVFAIIDRLEKRKEKRAKKEEEEKKNKNKKDEKKPETPKVSVLTTFLLMMTFGLPVGAGQLYLMKAAAEAIKTMLQ